MTAKEREAIAALWSEKLAQDARGLPKAERHRIDCEKDDYVRFLGLLKLSPGRRRRGQHPVARPE
jgi:hypothetical protein